MNKFSKIIRHLLIEEEMSITDLCELTNMSQPNLSRRLKDNNFKESDMHLLASSLGKRLKITLEDI